MYEQINAVENIWEEGVTLPICVCWEKVSAHISSRSIVVVWWGIHHFYCCLVFRARLDSCIWEWSFNCFTAKRYLQRSSLQSDEPVTSQPVHSLLVIDLVGLAEYHEELWHYVGGGPRHWSMLIRDKTQTFGRLPYLFLFWWSEECVGKPPFRLSLIAQSLLKSDHEQL